ncbi:type II toxin-antitoxin system RelE/ParE family toxin [Novipirellula rosea]|uniref:Plasmid stabilization system protein n=1 Tax=Novipirellula rosea TaxID=1031540 RepID=A0ABP8N503_9BACT
MKKPHYSTAARQDLVGILQYIACDKPGAPVAWVEKVEAKCLLLASQPDIGELRSQLGTDVRCNFVGRYVIFHRKHGDTVEILRVIPGDRNITKL